MPSRLQPALVLAVVCGAAACGDHAADHAPPGQCTETFKDVPVAINRDIDLLFVIDTSSSMAQEQASLAANFERFVRVLENMEGGLPNIHIGVVSADVGAGDYGIGGCNGEGDNGSLQGAPTSATCSGPTGAFISNFAFADGTRQPNYTGELDATFACIASLGADGCDVPQPLEAMRRALDGSNATNAGFLREHALLMVVFVTDGDDCSASDPSVFDPSNTSLGPSPLYRCFEHGVVCSPDEPRTAGPKRECRPRGDSTFMHNVGEYAQFLTDLKVDPAMVAVSLIAGGTEPVTVSYGPGGSSDLMVDASCTSGVSVAQPATRLGYFVDQFPQRATRTSICSGDLSDALAQLGELQSITLGVPCMEGDIDTDSTEPGVQYDCVVSDVLNPGTAQQEETIMHACPPDGPEPGEFPCWRMVQRVNYCPDTATGMVLEVERGPATTPKGLHTHVRCLGPCDIDG